MARRRRPAPSRTWESYAAPVAFLVAATVAVLLVRSALHHGGAPTAPPAAPAATVRARTTSVRTRTRPATTTATTATTSTGAAAGYYVVQAGDSFGSIAAKTGTTVAQIEQLNPGVSSTLLHVGQKIRVR